MPIGQTIATIASGVVQPVLDSIMSKKNQDRQNKANMEMAQYQFAQNKDMWNQQNLYNDPSNQMARLKKAGLNPNLVYGSGGATTQSAPAPSYQKPQLEYNQQLSIPKTGAILNDYINLQMQKQSMDQMKKQTQLIDEKILTEAYIRSKIMADNLFKGVQTRQGEQNLLTSGITYKRQQVGYDQDQINLAKSKMQYEYDKRVQPWKFAGEIQKYNTSVLSYEALKQRIALMELEKTKNTYENAILKEYGKPMAELNFKKAQNEGFLTGVDAKLGGMGIVKGENFIVRNMKLTMENIRRALSGEKSLLNYLNE